MASVDGDLNHKELDLKKREIDLKERELNFQIENKNKENGSRLGLSYPLVAAIWAALIGIFAQILSSYYTERQKMQYSMIQNALSDINKKQALRNLNFLVSTELVSERYIGSIQRLVNNSDTAPAFPGSGIRDEVVKISEVKKILKDQELYDAPIDEVDNSKFRRSIAAFQMKHGLDPDGLVGSCTLKELWRTTAEFGPGAAQAIAGSISVAPNTTCKGQ